MGLANLVTHQAPPLKFLCHIIFRTYGSTDTLTKKYDKPYGRGLDGQQVLAI